MLGRCAVGWLGGCVPAGVIRGAAGGWGQALARAASSGRAVPVSGATTATQTLAANPDVAEKIRGGKVAAAGAIVGAVMKATRGQADAARVRELVLAACGQS